MNGQYDNAFIGILQNEGSLEKFLDATFGFLMRRHAFYEFSLMQYRTDFFYEYKPGSKLGFPPEYAFKMVLKVSF